jgi:hypothetical protein
MHFRRRLENSFMACFRGEGQGKEENEIPASAVFSNVEVLYFGVVCPKPLNMNTVSTCSTAG